MRLHAQTGPNWGAAQVIALIINAAQAASSVTEPTEETDE